VGGAASIKAWIDIENDPQVQYLHPFAGAFESLGVPVTFTVRDYGRAIELLQLRGVEPRVIGKALGRSRLRKSIGVVTRAAALARAMRPLRPTLMLGTSRAAVLAAWMLRIPSFAVIDYEHAELQVFRRFGATVMHPDVIPQQVFLDLGYSKDALIPFEGLKEDISLAGVDLDEVRPHTFESDGLTTILFRPPAEDSHYFDPRSRELSLAVLEYLAGDADSRVVLSPRRPSQEAFLRDFRWANDPVVLREAIPFVSLLKGVDIVISSGGTMLREAACLGVPAVSIFQSAAGSVDTRLEAEGRLTFISGKDDFPKLKLSTASSKKPRRTHDPAVLQHLAEAILERTHRTQSR
jgi:predicted glycosyltransferase